MDSLLNKFSNLLNSILYKTQSFFDNRDSLEKINLLLKECSDKIEAKRVSYWKMESDGSYLYCESIYLAEKEEFQSGMLLAEEDYPNYFSSIHNNRVIDATDARSDFRTREFTSGYLIPNHIYSMYDAPIFMAGVLHGIICVEFVDNVKSLDIAELSYVVTISDAVSIILQKEEWLEERQDMERKQMIDSLTGLENRLYFEDRVTACYSNCNAKNTDCALILIDVNQFKAINDQFGIHRANLLLVELAERLRINLDLSRCHVARVQGDTFGVFVSSFDDIDIIHNLVEKIRNLTLKPFKMNQGSKIEIEVSIAVATQSESRSSGMDLIRCAEEAMLRGKSSHRQTSFYEKNWSKELIDKKSLELDLLNAISLKQFVPFYQPIISPSNNSVGIEALIRWSHPEKGILSPFKFLPIAQKRGLMKRIGEIMIEQACRDAKDLNGSGFNVEWVSVNLASEHLYSDKLIPFVSETLAKYDYPASKLELEIVEELIALDSNVVQSRFDKLRNMGVRLAIDDFGTGHSSLSRLKKLDVTKLKIDKSFVDGLPEDNNDQCITRAIIGLAKGMNISLVAEGVESDNQAQWLLENGCEFLQGYLFAKPMCKTDLQNFISERNKG